MTNDYEMVSWAYEQIAGAALPFDSVEELMWSVFSRQDYNNVALELRTDTIASQMLVEGLYGGTNVKNCGDAPGSRISNPTAANIQPGDILLVSEDFTPENTYIYLCTNEAILAQWSEELNEVVYLRAAYMAPVMESLLGQKAFAILRPSFILDSPEVEEMSLGQPDTADYQGTVIITSEVEWDGAWGNVEVLSLADGSKRVVRTQTPAQVQPGRVFALTVENGVAAFSSPEVSGLYDGTAPDLLTDGIRRASAVSWKDGILTYATDTGTAAVATDDATTIVLVSDTVDYGRLTDVQLGDTIPAAEGMSWNLLFRTDKNGVCQWVIAERDGNDISRSVGNPLALS